MSRLGRKTHQLIVDVFTEAYKEATPSADFDEMVKSGVSIIPFYFNNFYLSSEKLEEIVEKHFKKSKLPKAFKNAARFQIYLGFAPCSNLEVVRETRMKNGLSEI